MTNNREKILNQWTYDKAINFETQCLDDMTFWGEQVSKIPENRLNEIRAVKNRELKAGMSHKQSDEMEFDYQLQLPDVNQRITVFQNAKKDQLRLLDSLKSTKPFIVGPATIDSLVNKQPETYEYIDNSRLPFDSMFFEFFEPIEMMLPFMIEKKQICGVGLRQNLDVIAIKDYAQAIYGLNIYFKGDGLEKLEIVMPLNVADFISGVYKEGSFWVNLKSGTGNYTKGGIKSIFDDSYEKENLKFDDIKNNESFYTLANLCTNLINYINAHNVTFIKKERNVDVLMQNERGKNKKVTRMLPYYLINVKDDAREIVDLSNHDSHTLQWRVYVRGHDRRYRHEDKKIYKTTWIAPYVKGPQDAPWKENRYQVLADKLIREKNLIQKLG